MCVRRQGARNAERALRDRKAGIAAEGSRERVVEGVAVGVDGDEAGEAVGRGRCEDVVVRLAPGDGCAGGAEGGEYRGDEKRSVREAISL
ncbi:hypothetical protein Microterr_24880 [Microbacterium terricola]|uniref:Uncharacterized protein n=1 Tax=Microbacterium terricola TaxID=344163 RepID=A0ABM8E1K3_9MICO|nr:hypothetical protein Microterr_24880 [Microbacterium terricola]